MYKLSASVEECSTLHTIPWLAVWTVVLPYLAMIRDSTSLQTPFTTGPPIKSLADHRLRKVATGWNVFMALFSGWGAWQMRQLLLHPGMLLDREWSAPYYPQFEEAAWLYVVSKFWELVDTVLLYARGRTIGKLHWTHHVITLLYTVLAYNQCSHAAAYFASLNYAVHAVMYAYYAGLYWWPRGRRYGQYVTGLQITQFVWAMVYTWLYREQFAPWTYVAAWFMYLYYFVEFVEIWRTRQVDE